MAALTTLPSVPPAHGLVLIGIGLGDVDGITVAAKRAAATADVRRFEAYTALWPEQELKKLEAEIGPIEIIMRPEVEGANALLDLARNAVVALLVVGDPLQATTHVDLQLQASEAGVPCQVIHGISITSVVTGAVGLSNYKFGRQTTFAYPHGEWVATSPLEVLAANFEQNLHTLVLLDLDPTGQGTGQQQPMSPQSATQTFQMMWEKMLEDVEEPLSEEYVRLAFRQFGRKLYLQQHREEITVILCSDMGTAQQNIVATTMGELAQEVGGRLNCLVFPAGLSDVEEKAIARWKRGI